MDQTPKKTETSKGINWLNVIGLVILILVIGLVVVLFPILKGMQENKIVQDVSGMQPWLTTMETMTKAQIANEAQHTAAKDLLASPTGLEGRWVVTWGTVCADESNAVAGNIARNVMSEKNYPAFILDDGLVFVDITGEGELSVPDETIITGYGKVFVLQLKDVWAIPIVGPDLQKDFGNLKDTEQQVVFFLSKGYDIGEPGPIGELITTPGEGEETTEGETVEGEEAATGEEAAAGTEEGGEAAEPGEGAEAGEDGEGEGGEPEPPAEPTDPPAEEPGTGA